MKVVKIGGAILDKISEFDEVLKADILVHGGSDYVDDLFERLNKETKMVKSVSGVEFRYTPKEDMEFFLMAMMKANKEIVSFLQQNKINAIGLSGLDYSLIKAKRKKLLKAIVNGKKKIIRDDQSGKISEINTKTIKNLKNHGFPVIAPIAMSESSEPLNIDGDKLAFRISKDIQANQLIFLTDTAFLVDNEIVDEIRISNLEEYEKHAKGGMKRKIMMAEKAIENGIEEVSIIGLNGKTVIR